MTFGDTALTPRGTACFIASAASSLAEAQKLWEGSVTQCTASEDITHRYVAASNLNRTLVYMFALSTFVPIVEYGGTYLRRQRRTVALSELVHFCAICSGMEVIPGRIQSFVGSGAVGSPS